MKSPVTPESPNKKNLRYRELADYLREQIARGELKPGDRLPSYSQMKQRFDAYPVTVERLYAELEQDGLVVREARRGIFVASPTRSKATDVIGLLGVHPENPPNSYYMELMKGIGEAARRAGQEILVLNTSSVYKAGADSLRERIGGLLTVYCSYDIIRKARPAGLPCVSLLQPVDEVSSVVADDFGGAEQATRYLIECGHRRIGYVALIDGVTTIRLAGYESALRQAGVTPEDSWVRHLARRGSEQQECRSEQQEYRSEQQIAFQAMRDWLEGDWRANGCTAILAQNDTVAFGIMAALREAGLRVPDDVSVIGFDNLDICDFMTPALTSVDVSLAAIGNRGFSLLNRQMENGIDAAERLTLPARLVVRQSTVARKRTMGDE